MNDIKNQLDFVLSYFDDDGTNLDKLSASQEWEVYCLGDGLGKHNPAELLAINGGWDINHVRHSSKAAVNEMALKLMEFGERPKA